MKPFKQAMMNFGLYPNNNGPGPFKRWLIEWPHSASETSLKMRSRALITADILLVAWKNLFLI